MSEAERPENGMLVLGIDTCGPTGSVALGRLAGGEVEVLGETALEGKTYSATLVAAVGELLKAHRLTPGDVGWLVVVNGPGSFTGVRVGLSAAKGLAEGAGLRVVAVSRLEVLARKAGCVASALDAHRHEVYARVLRRDGDLVEMLAGRAEQLLLPPSSAVAVCEDAAAALIGSAWPQSTVLHVPPPTAADAMRLAAARIQAGGWDDVALLDGHYLRRSDAEIFGEK